MWVCADAAMCTSLDELAAVKTPGWTHDLPSLTSRALLQLLRIHVVHLAEVARVTLKSGELQCCTRFDNRR